jgi:putative tryptophan/tyrosine transport system substrate-binding protein
MRRREFIASVAGALSWPFGARAQQRALPVIGLVHSASAAYFTQFSAAVRDGLKEAGYVEGLNFAVEYRWAEGHDDRLSGLIASLIDFPVTVIFVAGGIAPTVAKAATTKIPIVFLSAFDPVKTGLVRSLDRPGGNVTGVSVLGSALEAKKVELLHELVPKASMIGAVINPNFPEAKAQSDEIQGQAKRLGMRSIMLFATTEGDIDAAFASLAQQGAGALVVGVDPFLNSRREQVVDLATRHALPVIYPQREAVAAGGLISYGTPFADSYRQAFVYVGPILAGAKPGDLPVVQPTKFELAINLQTVKALGLTVPSSLLALADEVIE